MKINIDNTEKLNIAIKEAEGRATARTITAEQIQYILHEVSEGITKPRLHGTKVVYDGAQHFPSAYRHRPDSTHWAAENIKGKWYVTQIWRGTCPNRLKNTRIDYSEEAKEAILANASWCEL